MDEVRNATVNCPTLQTAIHFARNGEWHKMKHCEFKNDNIDIEDLTPLRAVRDELTVHSDNILLRDHRIILPKVLRDRAIYVAHEGHQRMA